MSLSDRLRRHPLIQRLAVFLRSGPGPATLILVLAVLSIGGGWAAQHSAGAAAQAAATPVALATATPTVTPTVTASATATVTPSATATATRTPTRRAPTPTWTPLSSLSVPVSPLATPIVVVPLPPSVFGPHFGPHTPAITATVTLTPTGAASVTAAAVVSPSLVSPSTVSLLPTPTPTPTRTITDALTLPLPSGGIGATVATAESAASTPTPLPAAPEATAFEPTPDGEVRTAQVPVLMYHYVSVPPADADIYRRDLSVAPDLFAAHLDAMLAAGYTTITPYQLLAHLTQGAALPAKPVALTFDDGYRDTYENAFPRLAERGMVAAFFVVTDFIDEQRPEYLTWDMVRAMAAGGMAIESHGRNHVSLENKDSDYLIWQALGSLETIQYELGVRPRFVSYPAGDYDPLTIEVFRSAGYWAGFTTQQGATHRSDDLFQLRRVRVRGTTTADELVRLLGLDW
jgi:peptidoglycan/xylan/chitin deacetylase (PgdA/CDA1 family)